MKLTDHFQLREFTRSNIARRRGIDNTPGEVELGYLKLLCEWILEPLRVQIGDQIIVSSGYRSKQLNRAVRGARRSAHIEGRAADIECPSVSNRELANRIVSLALPYDKVILEYPGDDPHDGWVHVQIARAYTDPRKLQLVAYRSRWWPHRTRYAHGFDIPQAA